jgi:CheY-like chemotaxis protein
VVIGDGMDHDFLTLKMTIIGDDEAQCATLRHAAAAAAVPIEVTTFGTRQCAHVVGAPGRNAPDILCVDFALPQRERNKLAAAARHEKSRTFVILFGTSGADCAAAEADAVIEAPLDIVRARTAVERCVRARLPNRALVVDDSQTVRSIVRKIFRASRFVLETEDADEGAAALELVRSGRFDIVFLDCNMPGLDGFATLREIRQRHPRVETVMMTGTRDDEIAERARAAGAQGLLFKPFFPKDLDAVLHGLFGLNAAPGRS